MSDEIDRVANVIKSMQGQFGRLSPDLYEQIATWYINQTIPLNKALRSIQERFYRPISEAPKDGSSILALYEGEECEIRWAEQRQCMLAGVGGGNGYFGAGWEDMELGLITDEPEFWRPFPL